MLPVRHEMWPLISSLFNSPKAASRLRAVALHRAGAQAGRQFSVLRYGVYTPYAKRAVASLDQASPRRLRTGEPTVLNWTGGLKAQASLEHVLDLKLIFNTAYQKMSLWRLQRVLLPFHNFHTPK